MGSESKTKELSYLSQLTPCLTWSLVRVVLVRPEDPIQYLAHCLRTYRMVHPCPPPARPAWVPTSGKAVTDRLEDTGQHHHTDHIPSLHRHQPLQGPCHSSTDQLRLERDSTSSLSSRQRAHCSVSGLPLTNTDHSSTSVSVYRGGVSMVAGYSGVVDSEETRLSGVIPYREGEFVHLHLCQQTLLIGDIFDDDDFG